MHPLPPLALLIASLLIATPHRVCAQGGIGHVIEQIEIRGNEKTKSEIIHKNLPVKQGQSLSQGDIERCREVLERLGLFRTVFVSAKPGSENNSAILVVYVQEKRFGDLGISFEYTELDGFGVVADAYHVNLRGEGKIVGAAYGVGERLKHWGFHYTDPWAGGANQSFHLQITGASSDRDLYRSADPNVRGRYDIERIGAAMGFGQPSPLRAYQFILKYAFEGVQVGAVQKPFVLTGDGLFANEIEAAIGRETLSYLTLEFHKNPGHEPWGSASGTDFGIRVDLSSRALRSVADFIRLRMEYYRHIELFPGHIMSLGGRAGVIWGTPPFYERFYLDGENQLRGVDRRDIGPEGGTAFFMVESLYAIQINPLGRVYAFAESGGVRRPINGARRADIDVAVGLGLLLFNRIDISYGISTGTLIVKSHHFGGIKIGL